MTMPNNDRSEGPGTALEPCPFCGYAPVLCQIPNDGRWELGCHTAACIRPKVEAGRNKAKAITAWNRRAANSFPALVEALERLRHSADDASDILNTSLMDAAIKQADDALALAKGERTNRRRQ